jgi:NAD(P)-dependent dehydrogenase (short-subunit alcohol dehydrogenase family)
MDTPPEAARLLSRERRKRYSFPSDIFGYHRNPMRILVVGASGVLGRATLPNLRGHEIVGTTRSAEKREAVAALGACAEVCDVYRAGAVEQLVRTFAPEVVVNFLTDLAAGPGPANSRIRLEGGPIVTAAARAGGWPSRASPLIPAPPRRPRSPPWKRARWARA